MEDLFELMTTKEREGDGVSVRLGIRLKVAGQETLCPVSRGCHSYEALEKESRFLRDQLKRMEQNALTLFGDPGSQNGLHMDPDMPPEEIWGVLSSMADEELLVSTFNNLDESKRKDVAEYVLTQCNVFSGKAATFSSRYESDSGLMS